MEIPEYAARFPSDSCIGRLLQPMRPGYLHNQDCIKIHRIYKLRILRTTTSHEHDACGVVIANLRGEKSHQIVMDAVRILINLEHRGAVGADQKTGDGAGMLLQLPHDFFRRVAGVALPGAGSYAAGFFFLPPDGPEQDRARALVERVLREDGAELLAWRQCRSIPRLGRAGPLRDALLLAAVLHPRLGPSRASRPSAACTCCELKEVLAAGWGPERLPLPSPADHRLQGHVRVPAVPALLPDLSETDFESALAIAPAPQHQHLLPGSWPSLSARRPQREITLRRNMNNMRA
jgi:glutamate synthase (NADPH/NADH) large chain